MNTHESTGIRWLDHGSGLPVFVLHGYTCDHRLLLNTVEPALDGTPTRRIYPDLPAHGQTPAGSVASTDDVISAVAEFIDDEAGDSFALIGASFGAGVARGVLARDPSRVRGIAMLAPMVIIENRQLPELSPIEVDTELLASIDDPLFRDDFASLTHHQNRTMWERYATDVIPGALLGDPAGRARIRENYDFGERPESRFDTFDGPACFVLGRHDPVTGFQDALDLAPSYPFASYTIVRGGHNPYHEAPEQTRAALQDWAARL